MTKNKRLLIDLKLLLQAYLKKKSNNNWNARIEGSMGKNGDETYVNVFDVYLKDRNIPSIKAKKDVVAIISEFLLKRRKKNIHLDFSSCQRSGCEFETKIIINESEKF